MKTAALLTLALAVSLSARADFSYTTTSKTTGGSMGAMAGAAGDRTIKHYLKGQKMVTVTGDTSIVMDFGAQTVTTINGAQKSYTVKKFSDFAAAEKNVDVSVDVKETGQKKTVNGFNASEMIVTMNMDMETGRGPAMKMQMEMDMWISSDVPGLGELRAFYKKNLANFPFSAMAAGGNPSMQKAMAQLQRKMAEMNGVEVEQVIHVKPAGGTGANGAAAAGMPAMPAMPQMTSDQAAKMQAAMAQMQAMAKQGGQSGAAAQQAMAAMGGMGAAGGAGRGPAAGGGGALIEITMDSSGFSSASVPDSVFAIPAGYTQGQ